MNIVCKPYSLSPFFNRILFCLTFILSSAVSAAPLELEYWRHHAPEEITAITTLIDKFHQLHPEIKITLRPFPYNVYTTKLVATLSTGKGPDIINIHNSWAYDYIKSGLIKEVPEEIATRKQLGQQFFPILNSFSEYGHYYSLPIGASNLALFYNRKLFKQAGLDPDRPPKTWTELLEFAQKLTHYDQAGRIIQSGATLGMPAGQGWNYFVEGVLRQAGVPILSEQQDKVMWNNDRGVNALKWYTNFITKHKIYSHFLPNEYECFRLGLGAMMVSGSFQVGQLERVAPELDFSVAPLPVSDKGIKATFGSAWGNCVTRIAPPQKQKAAWKFISFLSSYENMKYWSKITGELPIRKEVLNDQQFLNQSRKLLPFIQQLEYSYASVKKDEGLYKRAITEAIEQIIYNGLAEEIALQRAALTINSMLKSK